jgi:hypothetical protein
VETLHSAKYTFLRGTIPSSKISCPCDRIVQVQCSHAAAYYFLNLARDRSHVVQVQHWDEAKRCPIDWRIISSLDLASLPGAHVSLSKSHFLPATSSNTSRVPQVQSMREQTVSSLLQNALTAVVNGDLDSSGTGSIAGADSMVQETVSSKLLLLGSRIEVVAMVRLLRIAQAALQWASFRMHAQDEALRFGLCGFPELEMEAARCRAAVRTLEGTKFEVCTSRRVLQCSQCQQDRSLQVISSCWARWTVRVGHNDSSLGAR